MSVNKNAKGNGLQINWFICTQAFLGSACIEVNRKLTKTNSTRYVHSIWLPEATSDATNAKIPRVTHIKRKSEFKLV